MTMAVRGCWSSVAVSKCHRLDTEVYGEERFVLVLLLSVEAGRLRGHIRKGLSYWGLESPQTVTGLTLRWIAPHCASLPPLREPQSHQVRAVVLSLPKTAAL